MKNRILLLTLGSALILSACGGGGGGSSTPAPVSASTLSPVTATNSTKVAGNAYAGGAAITDSSSSLSGMLTGVSVGRANISVVSPVLGLIKRAYPQDGTTMLTGVTASAACAGGGTVAVDVNLRNQTMVSSGDTISMTAKNCVEDGATINGMFAATFSNLTGDVLHSTTWSATLDTTFTNFSVSSGSETVSANGDMKIAITQTSLLENSLAISGKSLQTTEQRSGVTLANVTLTNYSMTGSKRNGTTTSAANFTMSGNTSALGRFSYTVRNIQPFMSLGSSMPYTGSLIVTGASSSVMLTATSASTVRVEFSAKGDGVPTQITDMSWIQFLTSI